MALVIGNETELRCDTHDPPTVHSIIRSFTCFRHVKFAQGAVPPAPPAALPPVPPLPVPPLPSVFDFPPPQPVRIAKSRHTVRACIPSRNVARNRGAP